jgi:hypothetical protein
VLYRVTGNCFIGTSTVTVFQILKGHRDRVRVLLNTEAPLILPGILSTAGPATSQALP